MLDRWYSFWVNRQVRGSDLNSRQLQLSIRANKITVLVGLASSHLTGSSERRRLNATFKGYFNVHMRR